MTVTIYSKPACVQCDATYRAMDKNGIEYNVIDITKDAEAFDKIANMGFMQAPVVMTENDSWCGFRPDMIAKLASQVAVA